MLAEGVAKIVFADKKMLSKRVQGNLAVDVDIQVFDHVCDQVFLLHHRFLWLGKRQKQKNARQG